MRNECGLKEAGGLFGEVFSNIYKYMCASSVCAGLRGLAASGGYAPVTSQR